MIKCFLCEPEQNLCGLSCTTSFDHQRAARVYEGALLSVSVTLCSPAAELTVSPGFWHLNGERWTQTLQQRYILWIVWAEAPEISEQKQEVLEDPYFSENICLVWMETFELHPHKIITICWIRTVLTFLVLRGWTFWMGKFLQAGPKRRHRG